MISCKCKSINLTEGATKEEEKDAFVYNIFRPKMTLMALGGFLMTHEDPKHTCTLALS
jgi:hypothetical protein